jgi:rSAM/selenodomain-associated transferase 2
MPKLRGGSEFQPPPLSSPSQGEEEQQVISIIIPALNESEGIAACLMPLQPLRAAGHEIIVVDGGSRDETVALAQPLADKVIRAPRGRASQMNAGARIATGKVLLFLHADTRLPAEADRLIVEGMARSGKGWGRFDVRLSGRQSLLRVVERMMNRRSRLTGISTGDQAVFVRREWFDAIGGFPEIPLMEDVELSRRLKRLGSPLCLRPPVITSSRRWEAKGILRTILLMWRLRLGFFFGENTDRLARRYYGG